MNPLLALPPDESSPLSIRARALVFEDPRSRVVLDTLARIAPQDAPALIIGAAGTGKELVARHVHYASGRTGPFVAADCSAFETGGAEAALFGVAVGARARPGLFEAARGGTLFLDEIGDLPPGVQAALARALEDGRIARVGASSTTEVDVRVVAATHVDLARAVESGRFRRDLWYRLSVATLPLPALAERPGDIVPLARHFVQAWSARLGLPSARLAADGIAALQAYPWPGNIRELESVVHHALLVARDGVLRADDLRLAGARATGFHPVVGPAGPTPAAEPATPDFDAALRALLLDPPSDLQSHVEHRLVHAAYAMCQGNQVRTARLLGISRNVLRAQLLRFGYLTPTGERRAVRTRPVAVDEAATA